MSQPCPRPTLSKYCSVPKRSQHRSSPGICCRAQRRVRTLAASETAEVVVVAVGADEEAIVMETARVAGVRAAAAVAGAAVVCVAWRPLSCRR
eukprot:scaffold47562_cov29-Tisochrysis_lutea.AAC.1